MSKPESFFDGLIDDFGIRHHTDGQNWLKSTGYSLDDAARGLLVCLTLGKQAKAEVLLGYIEKSRVGSDFYGFASAERQFNTYPCSEDAKGQVVWALGYALSRNFEVAKCQQALAHIQDSLLEMRYVRGYAYALLGSVYFDLELAAKIVKKIDSFMRNCTEGWFWPEDQLTYGNGIVPYSLLRYSLLAKDEAAAQTAGKLLNFLQQACTESRALGPIGNDGWFKKGDARPADYSQQPVDAAYMVMAWLAEYQYSNDKASLNQTKNWLDWFEGNNIAGQKMYQPDDLKSFDGIDKDGINPHSGAESNICFLLARHLYEQRLSI